MRTEYPQRYVTLGLKIAYYRKKAGFTQEVFAEKIGKSVNFLGQVEGTGTVRGVSLETLFKIADVLGIPPSKLLEDDGIKIIYAPQFWDAFLICLVHSFEMV